MSNSHKNAKDTAPKSSYTSNALWHVSRQQSLSLGCQDCFFRSECGGLEVQAAVFDCTDFCQCADQASCDNVCPKNPTNLAARSQEVRGFKLDVPRVPCPKPANLPNSVPLIQHGSRRAEPLRAHAVALPLARLVSFSRGNVKYASRTALLEAFHLAEECRIVLTGTDRDRYLERWWQLPDRSSVIRDLVNLGVVLVTTPNFSLFDDVPRHDNLYNVKRIAITWSEFQNGGMPCALHLNARTDRDWERWNRLLETYTEIEHVAVEFGTGAGYENRIQWHVEQLTNLARQVHRPLNLIVRGGVHMLPSLNEAFDSVSLIDSRPFVKTFRRQRAVLVDGRLRWKRAPTPMGAPLDALLHENIEIVSSTLPPPTSRIQSETTLMRRYESSRAANDAHHESLQRSGLLTDVSGED